ncbi:Adaptor protein complex AP-3 delta subunit [Whalleya microplaca]|nr:Adaptor protein complex AP-3 delta subunit [Whalleya microplaca]
MFEKSLYDLIRGLRNHKGHEKEYIQNCLKECRAEVRSQDLDVKATALLKLIYLEMFGHDMSWASFNVLEVMASAKYHQKRVGYLGAIQSFRPDTEVLMLATNLLKKDLTAASTTTIALPIISLPHVITPSLALSVLPDLLPRLSHTHPTIRKKTIVTLYRLALVYPETLRAAWPKIKERLMDKNEDPSVTAAIINVVCELGWRRPRDFLPLAPRLFELLVDSGNNWMVIKLIKLFATLTPLEPRLVRKLLPPLTEIIRTTPAMSLLYECISGIIQGGILGSGDDADGREEIASLCVKKLRGMIMIDGDPNLKYVALLAFNQIVVTHPWLVAQQEDVILECIDSTDISIRIKALDLVQGMVSSDNLVSIVSRLMRQLKLSSSGDRRAANAPGQNLGDSDEDDFETTTDPGRKSADQAPPLPDDYRVDVVNRVLNMCSQNNYANLTDFIWYIDILTQLVRTGPLPRPADDMESLSPSGKSNVGDISERIGDELRNITVKVQAVRPACVEAAEVIISQFNLDAPIGQPIVSGALKPVSWILGEFASELSSPEDTLGSLLQLISKTSSPESLAACLQAAMKVFSLVAGDQLTSWTPERKSKVSLLMARIVHSFEALVLHPNLEVQERAVEFTELLKLTTEAASSQEASTEEIQQDPPLLLTQAIPSLFAGWELNSVAVAAQRNVPIPKELDLDEPINPNLNQLLASAESISAIPIDEADEFDNYYYQRPAPTSIASEPAINKLAGEREESSSSYQQPTEDTYLDADILAKRKAERLEKNRDDPFYIQASSSSIQRSSTPIHNILSNSNGPELDVDSIPIMELDLDKLSAGVDNNPLTVPRSQPKPSRQKAAAARQKIVVAADENLGGSASGRSTPGGQQQQYYDSETGGSDTKATARAKAKAKKLKASILGVDSTSIEVLNLEGDDADGSGAAFDPEARRREEAEMAQAMREVERLRLEMQRANERIQVAQGVDVEGTVVKKKKKAAAKKSASKGAGGGGAEGDGNGNGETAASGSGVKVKKKKKKVAAIDDAGGTAEGAVVKSKVKKKKAKPPAEIQETV